MQTIHTTHASVNVLLLNEELESLGAIFEGMTTRLPDIEIFLSDSATQQDIDSALTIVDNHDAEGISSNEATQAIEQGAAIGWDAIPNWATWTATEAEDWIETNVTTFAEAKVVLKKQAVAIMWLADRVFPNRR
jgi:hypothetical protein